MSVETTNKVYLSREDSDLCGSPKIILEKKSPVRTIWIYQNPRTMCYLIQDDKDSIKCHNVGKDIEPYISSYETDGWEVKRR